MGCFLRHDFEEELAASALFFSPLLIVVCSAPNPGMSTEKTFHIYGHCVG
jgi:hypothetical protein